MIKTIEAINVERHKAGLKNDEISKQFEQKLKISD